MKSNLFIAFIVCILVIILAIVGGVSVAEILHEGNDFHSFDELGQVISNGTEIDLNHNYRCENSTNGITIDNPTVINGNDHIIEAINETEALVFESTDAVVNNLTFSNRFNINMQSASANVTFNNVEFLDYSSISNDSTFITSYDSNITFNNCTFKTNVNEFSQIFASNGKLIFRNCEFSGNNFANTSRINCDRGDLVVENSTFKDISSKFAPAINYKGPGLKIVNSSFINLDSRISAGAVMAKFFPYGDSDEALNKSSYDLQDFLIENCTFSNVKSTNDGGAIYVDLHSGSNGDVQKLDIVNSSFTDAHSRFGGGIAILGGVLNVKDSTFSDNSADFSGGAIYSSWCDVNIDRTEIVNNNALRNASAIYFDMGKLTLDGANVSGNSPVAVYANDASLDFSNSTFDNGGLGVYGNFINQSKLDDVSHNNDTFSLNNTDYITSVENDAISLNLKNSSSKINSYPSKYDLRDYGWVNPIKSQGDSDDCWAFATANSIESSILKAAGKSFDLSENYIQKLQLKYCPTGDMRNNQTGFAYSGLGYALSWYGVLLSDADYDDRGLISDMDIGEDRIHVQDAMIIFGGRNDTNELIKHAIMNYGGVSVQIDYANQDNAFPHNHYGNSPNPSPNHFVSIIGWDDDYPVDKFSTHPPKPGAWIYKDSLEENNFEYMSYYDTSLLSMDHYPIVGQNAGVAYIFENDNDYHINYQTDLTGLTGFDENYTQYSNEFVSKANDSIAAVGTYFNESGIDYSFDIYVNGKLAHSQDGVSEFAGFKTIVLNKHIPVKESDSFKVVFKSNSLPYQAFSRQHYMQNVSFASHDGKTWDDFSKLNKTVCLKVYTIR